MKQFEHISIKDYHTFHTENKSELLTLLGSIEEAQEYFKQHPLKTKRLVIGEGSNLLFTKDFEGELIKIENKGFEILQEKGGWIWIKAAAGESWDDLVRWTVQNGYGGIENLSYIPGTVGAAPVQNIGAYGVELQEVFNSLEAVDMSSGKKTNFYLQELEFDYRYSVFKGPLRNRFLITSVVLKLNKYPKVNLKYGHLKEVVDSMHTKSFPDIKDVREAVIQIRKSKLPDPDKVGNAGSFFKNPVISAKAFHLLQNDYPKIVNYPLPNGEFKLAAAWLIEKAGFKGYSLGEAGTHPKHALIIINKGKAKGEDLRKLAEMIQNKVRDQFLISLEPEVLMQ